MKYFAIFIYLLLNKFIKILINYVLGPLLMAIVGWVLYRQIITQPDLTQKWSTIKQSWHQPLFWVAILLMFVNYGMEARKWQLLVKHCQPFSFIKAVKSVFAGCSITMITPNRIGEYGGRILYMEPQNRLKAIPLTVLGSISQMLITFVMGIGGLTFFLLSRQTKADKIFDYLPVAATEVLILLLLVFTVVLFIAYINEGAILNRLERFKPMKKILGLMRLLEGFGKNELWRLLSLSFFRYLVFTAQYLIFLKVMDVDIELTLAFWAIAVFYLLMAIIPTIGFTELPVRAATSAGLLGIFNNNLLGIQAAAFAVWLTNIILPAIIGSIFISVLRLLKNKNEFD